MKTSKVSFLVASALTLAAFAAQTSLGQAPTGSITNNINNSNNTLFDATLIPLQTIEMDIVQDKGGVNNEVTVTYDDPFTQDGKGKLAGTGSTDVVVTNSDPYEAVSFTGTYQTKGAIKSNNGIVSMKFASSVSGNVDFQGGTHSLKASGKYSVTIDVAQGTLTGVAQEKASASGLGSLSQTTPIDDVIPPELGDGSWTLILNLDSADGSHLTGSATVTLQTGQVYPFSIKGTFVSSTGMSKLSLTGTDAAAGSKLTVMLQDSNVASIKGKVAGQTINLVD